MKQTWTIIWSLISAILGSAMPIAKGVTYYAQAFERTGSVTDKVVATFEAGVDLDQLEATHKLEARRAELASRLGLV